MHLHGSTSGGRLTLAVDAEDERTGIDDAARVLTSSAHCKRCKVVLVQEAHNETIIGAPDQPIPLLHLSLPSHVCFPLVIPVRA